MVSSVFWCRDQPPGKSGSGTSVLGTPVPVCPHTQFGTQLNHPFHESVRIAFNQHESICVAC